jgi:hypothetical protein
MVHRIVADPSSKLQGGDTTGQRPSGSAANKQYRE